MKKFFSLSALASVGLAFLVSIATLRASQPSVRGASAKAMTTAVLSKNLDTPTYAITLDEEPSDEAVKRAIGKIVLAGITHSAAGQAPPTDLVDRLAWELARRVRDELVESAVKDVFPGKTEREVRAARRVICLALDGRLNARDYTSATSIEELIAALKKADPDIGAAADLADFIGKVVQNSK